MHVGKYLVTLWKIARPRTLLLIILQGVLAYSFLGEAVPNGWYIFLGLVVVVCAYMHAVAVNDISDEVVDALNEKELSRDKDRPLLDKTVTTGQLWLVAHIVALVWLIASAIIAWQLCLVSLLLVALNFAYSLPPIRLSARGSLAQFTLPLMYVAYPFYIAAVLAGTSNLLFWLLMASLYVAFVGRLFLKDIRDEKGDAATGKRTFLVRHGLKKTLYWASVCISLGLLGIGLILTLHSGLSALLFVVPVSVLGVIYAARACYHQKHLALQLLDIAVIGRLVSMVVFVSLIVLCQDYIRLGFWQGILLQGMAAIIFTFGLVGLYEEKRSTRKRLV